MLNPGFKKKPRQIQADFKSGLEKPPQYPGISFEFGDAKGNALGIRLNVI